MDSTFIGVLIAIILAHLIVRRLIDRGRIWSRSSNLPDIKPTTALEAAEAVCVIATDQRRSDLSLGQLIRRSRYRKYKKQITTDVLAEVLRRDRKLIGRWIELIEDKRSSPSWIFRNDGAGWYVQLFPHGEKIPCEGEAEACATFILKEINQFWYRL